ncbi:MAG: hypothetical protein MJB12_15485 [Firmicutes bacterium]|nr:hypothetical protein [Bacillota bacterium]
MRRRITFIYITLVVFLFLWIYGQTTQILPNEIFEYYKESFFKDTGAQNAVAAIYLNYRVYDTLFEALMLLIGVIGIIYFSRHEGGH